MKIQATVLKNEFCLEIVFMTQPAIFLHKHVRYSRWNKLCSKPV